jgi:hypothetical protein
MSMVGSGEIQLTRWTMSPLFRQVSSSRFTSLKDYIINVRSWLLPCARVHIHLVYKALSKVGSGEVQLMRCAMSPLFRQMPSSRFTPLKDYIINVGSWLLPCARVRIHLVYKALSKVGSGEVQLTRCAMSPLFRQVSSSRFTSLKDYIINVGS